MCEFPLLDLAAMWKDALYVLTEIHDFAEHLSGESEQTWPEMMLVHLRAAAALRALGTLPPGILEGITKDKADLAAMEDRADASSS